MSFPLVGVLFSRDRAMQLDAALRSFYRHCADASSFDLAVLYRTTNATHARQYEELIEAYSHHPRLRFIREIHFWRDLLGWLGEAGLGGDGQKYRRRLRLGRRFGFLRRGMLDGANRPYVLFLVDDNLFVRSFRLAEVLRSMEVNPQALGFSLRLGTNTAFCYTSSQAQPLPAFVPAVPSGKSTQAILAYDWTVAEGDFGYPLEVSSSIYRLDDLLPFLDTRPFANPNELESRLAEGTADFRQRSQLLCYLRSVTFCSPVNKVNDAYRNRAGETHPYSSTELAEKFDAGYRIDVAAYAGFLPSACHQEVELRWLEPPEVESHEEPPAEPPLVPRAAIEDPAPTEEE